MSLLAVFALAGALSEAEPSCDGDTMQTEACLGQRLAAREAVLASYVSAARERIRKTAAEASGGLGFVDKAPKAFDAAEAAWAKYRDALCDAVYDYWSEGTIRGIKSIQCRLRVTREHTHAIWTDWLRYEDSTPAILPEPPTAGSP